MIRIIIVEDYALIRDGIRALLERSADIEIIGEASDGLEAVLLAEQLTPDVIVMDIMMPRMNGIQAATRIRELEIKSRVILLSIYADEGLVHQAIESGVRGYVLKSAVSEELLLAIRAVARNETFLSGQVSNIIIENSLNQYKGSKNIKPSLDILSPREKEVLGMIANELTTNEIADTLQLSERTVEKYRAHLLKKLHARNIAGLVRLALKFGLVDKDS